MRPYVASLVGMVITLACTSAPNPLARGISCQPSGYTPAPIAFSFDPGPATASAAEATAVALFRGCQVPNAEISELTSSSTADTGSPSGPNVGQAIWRVQVDATVNEGGPNATYRSHFVIEVNQASGIPTVIAYG